MCKTCTRTYIDTLFIKTLHNLVVTCVGLFIRSFARWLLCWFVKFVRLFVSLYFAIIIIIIIVIRNICMEYVKSCIQTRSCVPRSSE